MAIAGTYTYSVTGGDIITEALELIGVTVTGADAVAAHQKSCLRTLEMMIKAWQADGIGLWKNTEAALFLEYEAYEYDLGPTGDHCTSDWVKTEVETAGVLGDLALEVDSIAGISDEDYIGVELDDESLQWTTVNGAPSGTTVTLTAALTDAATADNHVYAYTTKLQRPLRITEARIRVEGEDDNDNCVDVPLEIKHRNQYMAIADKEATGAAGLIYYDPQLTNGNLHVYPACDDVQDYLKFTAKVPISNFDAVTNDPEFPQEWFMALSWNLAILVAPKYGKVVSNNFEVRAMQFKRAVSLFDRQRHPIGLSA